MTVYKHWVNFVSYPLEPDRIRSQEERLATEGIPAVLDRENYEPSTGGVVTMPVIVAEDDEFEAMEVTTGGGATVWTRNCVWALRHQYATLEKLSAVPRHPPASDTQPE